MASHESHANNQPKQNASELLRVLIGIEDDQAFAAVIKDLRRQQSREAIGSEDEERRRQQTAAAYEHAERLLDVVEPKSKYVYFGDDGEGGDDWQLQRLRESVRVFHSEEGDRELVLADTSGENGTVIGVDNFTLYVRPVSYSEEENVFEPGEQLCHIRVDGAMDGPIEDPVIIEGFLQMFDTSQ